MITEDGTAIPDPDPQSLLEVRAAWEMIHNWRPTTEDWPPIGQLLAEIEAEVEDRFGGPLVVPTLPTVRRATWVEIRQQLAAQKCAHAARSTRPPRQFMLPGVKMPDPASKSIRTEAVPATPERREIVEAEVVSGTSQAPASWGQIQSPRET